MLEGEREGGRGEGRRERERERGREKERSRIKAIELSSVSRFHAEVAKVEEEFAGVMDALAVEAATGIHSTKKERTMDTT